MAAKSQPRRNAAATVAIIERWHGPEDPRLPDLRRDLRAAELEEHIRRLVDTAPPLTHEQRARLAALLTNGGGQSAAA
ncbi:hypothetical protein ACIBPB_03815 [Micromonospora sp. NPDC049836]|uniref:hypothetical protein n=1 Tax=Micromonospora sp. NPDC049836 TaxID=3364274 RepID=UPI00379590F7